MVFLLHLPPEDTGAGGRLVGVRNTYELHTNSIKELHYSLLFIPPWTKSGVCLSVFSSCFPTQIWSFHHTSNWVLFLKLFIVRTMIVRTLSEEYGQTVIYKGTMPEPLLLTAQVRDSRIGPKYCLLYTIYYILYPL
jgi:hypothetical protein